MKSDVDAKTGKERLLAIGERTVEGVDALCLQDISRIGGAGANTMFKMASAISVASGLSKGNQLGVSSHRGLGTRDSILWQLVLLRGGVVRYLVAGWIVALALATPPRGCASAPRRFVKP